LKERRRRETCGCNWRRYGDVQVNGCMGAKSRRTLGGIPKKSIGPREEYSIIRMGYAIQLESEVDFVIRTGRRPNGE
jgi:hypothetical protein